MAEGGRQQDAGEVERVQDLLRGVPQAGGFEKLDVQPGAVAHGLPAAQEVGEEVEGGVGIRCPPQFVLLDPGQPEDRVRHRAAGIDQALERGCDPVRGEGDRTDFDDAVSGRVETGGLEVQGGVLRQVSCDFTSLEGTFPYAGLKVSPEM